MTESFLSEPPGLTSDDVGRFSRQIMCEGISAAGMIKIRNSKVVCVGLGGLGSTIALYLCAAGVGKMTFIDHDEVDVSNLHRQVIHSTEQVGVKKVDSAKEACLRIYPDACIETVEEMISLTNATRLFADCDVVVDGTDNVASRYIINDAAMLCKRPLVSGSAMRWEGQLSVYGYKEGPCYRCLFPVPPPAAAVGSCNDTGVVGPLPGMIGCLQALETLKIIADAGETLSGRLFVFDGRRFTSRVVKLRGRNPDCTACGASALSSETLPPREEYVPTCCAVGAAYSAGVLSASQRTSIEEFGKWYTNRHTLNTPDRVSLVVDVRARIQYSMAYLPDSVNLPLSELQRWRSEGEEICRFKFFHFLEEAIKSSEGTKHVTVFFICRRGVASTQATELLSKVIPTLPAEVTPHVTLDRIVNVDGGLNAYHSQVDAGFPYY